MKELDVLIDALEKRNVIKAIKLTLSIVPLPDDPNEKEEKVHSAIREILEHVFADDYELSDKFDDFSIDLGLETLTKEISKSVKPDRRMKDALEEIIHGIAEILNKI